MMNHEERIGALEKQVKILAELEKRLALAVVDVLPVTTNNVSGYDIHAIRTSMGVRWVWKHFLRGARSAATFETREACVRSAQSDQLKNLAYPLKDFAHILNKDNHERKAEHEGAPAMHLVTGGLETVL